MKEREKVDIGERTCFSLLLNSIFSLVFIIMKNFFINSIDKISNQDYKNILKDEDSPLISHEFLNALEASGSAIQGNGWQPMHLILEDDSNLSGFLPLYLKNNSHGEFVFDHQWSYALKRAGREYYPKLLSAIPFTPCETRKFISKNQIEAIKNWLKNKKC